MLSGEQLDKRFDEFVHSLQDGEIIVDAIMFFASISPEQESGTVTYGAAFFGNPPRHRCLGLIEIGKEHL